VRCHLVRAFVFLFASSAFAQTESPSRADLHAHVTMNQALGPFLREVHDVDLLFAAGARSITLLHFADNTAGHAALGQSGPLPSSWIASDRGGLTELGRAIVTRMFELGIVIDVAHANAQTAHDVLDMAERVGASVIYSHAGEDPLRDRNLEDSVAVRIARTGGLIGIGLFRFGWRRAPEADRWPGFQEGTCDEAIAHWMHFSRIAGADAIALGSDLNSIIVRGGPGGACPRGIRNTQDLTRFFQALEQRDVPTRGALARTLELFERSESLASPTRRAAALRRRPPREDLFDVPV
jgi:membrane dipeptidase